MHSNDRTEFVYAQAALILPEERWMTDLSINVPLSNPHINWLSDEVLSDIFLYCCRQSPSEPLLRTDAPLSVASVSSRWRQIALTSPRLWSCISYSSSDHPDDASKSHFVKSLDCLNTWLRRSGAVPLKLRVTSFSYIKPIVTTDLVRYQRHRVVEVHLFLSHGSLTEDGDAGLITIAGLPKLERFTFSYIPAIIKRIITIDLSQLRTVREVALLGNVRIASIRSSLPELKRFTYADAINPFHVAGGTLMDALKVLDISPGLYDLNLRGAYYRHSLPSDGLGPRKVCAQNLRKLSLVFDRAVHCGRLFLLDRLTLPALEDAEIYFPKETGNTAFADAHSVLSLFQRSGPELKRLSIGGGCINDADLLSILRLVPTLRSLELVHHTFTNLKTFLDHLTIRSDSEHKLCSDLEMLVFLACPSRAPTHVMADMIISRCQDYDLDDGGGIRAGTLRRMHLHDMDYLDLWEDEAILDCFHEGLDLLVT